MAASMALGCGPEAEPRRLLPYVEQPPGIVPGRPRAYATAATSGGYATGVLVTHQMGRPIKIEGNPDHPASLGAASAQIQATILDLYDPRRSQSITRHHQLESWEAFVTAIIERRGRLAANRGQELRLLTGTVTSPSLAARIEALKQEFPAMRWHQWEPLDRDNELAACQRALGRPLDLLPDLNKADVIFAVESDLLSSAPGHLVHARAFAIRRRPLESQMSRLNAIESTPTLAGAKADHQRAMRPSEIGRAMRCLAALVGAGPAEWRQQDVPQRGWLVAASRDLLTHHGRALVHAGREQPEEIHMLAHAINGALGSFGNTLRLIEPVVVSPTVQRQSLAELVADMSAGKVDTLFMLETNPAYVAPADHDFVAALGRVPLSVCLSACADETALASTWHLPAAHEYERWADARLRRDDHDPAAAGNAPLRRPVGA
jgi:hypothetical protein